MKIRLKKTGDERRGNYQRLGSKGENQRPSGTEVDELPGYQNRMTRKEGKLAPFAKISATGEGKVWRTAGRNFWKKPKRDGFSRSIA